MYFKIFLFLSLMSFSFFSKGQARDYLVGYYPFEDGKAKDYTKRGGSGIIYGNLQTIKGIKGEALRFKGDDDYIVFNGGVNRFLRKKRNFTISFYFRSDDPNQVSNLMGKRTQCKGFRMFDMIISKGKLKTQLYEKSSVNANASTMITDQGWHHYVYVRDGNTVRLFVDGELKDEEQIRRIIPIDDLAYFAINGNPCNGKNGTGNLVGAIDELKIFKVALTKRDIRNLFRKISIPPPPMNSTSSFQRRNPNNKNRTNSSAEKLALVFGNYGDAESQSSFLLNPKFFILTIKNPAGYDAEELIYEGKYKIENGDLYLLRGEIVLKNANGETIKKMNYQEKIIGDLYENGLDLFAFETRMKLRK